MITGESLPISKSINSEVIGGTLITSGSIKISVTKIGENTVLSQIIELVKNAQRDQPEIQKFGDKVSSIFVPIVILISIMTFIISHYLFNISSVDAFLRSIAVLVVSCPCAMGLATPTAIMVGIGRAAKNGILIDACNNLAAIPPSGRHKFEYAPGVECILIPTETLPPSTHTNCFILGHPGGERIIIDPAVNDDHGFSELKLKIEEIKAENSSIIATLFTHKHRDHIGDLQLISKLYSAPIWATEITLESLSGSFERLILKDGDIIEISGPKGIESWEIMETPGHCPGQICLVSDLGIISADNCTASGTILVPSEDGDMDEYILGLERIRERNPGILFPGHGPFIPNPRKLIDRYISHRKKRHQLVLQAIKQGINELSEISKFTYSDTPNAHPILSEDQTKSHLKSWIKSGEISKIDDEFHFNN